MPAKTGTVIAHSLSQIRERALSTMDTLEVGDGIAFG
jgi:hypothetical protein